MPESATIAVTFITDVTRSPSPGLSGSRFCCRPGFTAFTSAATRCHRALRAYRSAHPVTG